MEFGGRMYDTTKSHYSNCEFNCEFNCEPLIININCFLQIFFPSEFGVSQGDTFSLTQFGLYINDLAYDLRACNTGLNTGIFYLKE